MPKNVLQYFKYVNQGMSKAAARKKAGLPPKKGGRKKWGPGHPLYEWQKKYTGKPRRKRKRKGKRRK